MTSNQEEPQIMDDKVTILDGNVRRTLEGRINVQGRRRDAVRDTDPELARTYHKALLATSEEMVALAESASSSVRSDVIIGKLRRLQSEQLDPLARDYAAAAETGERIARAALGDGRVGVASREYLTANQYWLRAGYEERADDALGRSMAAASEYRTRTSLKR